MKSKLLVASLVALMFAATAYAQSAHDHGSAADAPRTGQQTTPPAAGGMGMHGEGGMQGQGGEGMQGMMGMQGMEGMHGQGGQGMHGMMRGMRFPPGYEKLELQMHAEMMESMARIMKKYAAKLPDKQ